MDLGIGLLSLVIVVYGAFALRLERSAVSMPMLFVGVGLFLGPAVTGLLPIQPEAHFAQELTEVALGLLLFGDAATLNMRQVQQDAGLPLRLLLIGLPLSLILGTVTAMLLLPGENWAFAFLLGAILAPTDAALGLPIFNNPKVPVRIRRALNVESGLNDGLATPFVVLAISLAAASSGESGGNWLATALREISVGALIGAAVAAVGGRLLILAEARGWTSGGPSQIAVLGMAIAAFFGARAFGGNGFIAAFIGGMVLSRHGKRDVSDAAEFTEQVGTVLSLGVWTIFGAALLPQAFRHTTDLAPIIYALVSLTIVRMVPVALALVGARLRHDTVALMGWFGPRGLASVVFTLMAFVQLEAAGKLDTTLVATAVWTILFSVVAHGVSAGPLASWYARRLATAEGQPVEMLDLPEMYRRRLMLSRPAAAQPTGESPAN